ncbi:MAG TPA: undecaprenyldiphospho-muramoylpentapeptide beta-N-acetylglucosaminyltransferase [Thermoanaerobaculia bacterium]|jgi:UDP-N-acetylglucosamine--N-acetylmuramyl-(pentapeptide) pyrophosphoryl-undecaprenol N-acetylglucosamine transferase|nr:undecaprenyldiphospho-muramoylpentapeptide beta-N-acetylglucosaminyltransferase [Thermoanaerobaculia bacterium]
MTRDDEIARTTSVSTARTLHALLAGGGTGGHIFPALAVAEELGRRAWRVSFAGAENGLEARIVPERGIPFHALPARPLVGRGIAGKVQALTTLAASGRAAARLIRNLEVDVVLGTGGYVSAPAVVGARLAGRPVLLLEPNARAGVANRWLSRFASGAAIGYAETAHDLKCPAWVTGVPVRAAFSNVPAELPPLDSPHVLVLGGSQGAQQINEAMPAAARRLLERLPETRIIHQAGHRNLEEAREAYSKAGLGEPQVQVVPFVEDVAGAMAWAHLLVSRAGAITLAEICAAGRPSVLMPLSISLGHQVDNARLIADAGAAELLLSDQVEAGKLGDVLLSLLSGPDAYERLSAMGKAARGLARAGAVAEIADRMEMLGGVR